MNRTEIQEFKRFLHVRELFGMFSQYYRTNHLTSNPASLVKRYGRGFSMRNLYNFISFYQNHRNIFHAVSGKSENIVNALRAQSQDDDEEAFDSHAADA